MQARAGDAQAIERAHAGGGSGLHAGEQLRAGKRYARLGVRPGLRARGAWAGGGGGGNGALGRGSWGGPRRARAREGGAGAGGKRPGAGPPRGLGWAERGGGKGREGRGLG
jgi:hypothetical protein